MKHYEKPEIGILQFTSEDIMDESVTETETETDTVIDNSGEWN